MATFDWVSDFCTAGCGTASLFTAATVDGDADTGGMASLFTAAATRGDADMASCGTASLFTATTDETNA
eukprot:COSAG05_NODE_9756_length_603_cov_1.009921_1_plen_69_part_00